jgi:peptidoglycan hydrolase-like protein with peptidoglycan-binding domain
VVLVASAGLTNAATAVQKKSAHPALPKKHLASATKGKKLVRPTSLKPLRRSKPTASRSYVQPQPSPERYQQIQAALAAKGYYKGEPNGQWSADSADALKRFQGDQNLTADGKLNSLSLIALGLGPKRITAQATPAPVTTESGVRQ